MYASQKDVFSLVCQVHIQVFFQIKCIYIYTSASPEDQISKRLMKFGETGQINQVVVWSVPSK